jgi:hypothetical protein
LDGIVDAAGPRPIRVARKRQARLKVAGFAPSRPCISRAWRFEIETARSNLEVMAHG